MMLRSETKLSSYLFNKYPFFLGIESIRNIIISNENDLEDPCSCVVSIYRIGHSLSKLDFHNKGDVLKHLSFLQRQIGMCEIYFSANIGKNFLIAHAFGTVIASRVLIGDNVTIYQNVTVGALYDTSLERPIIHDDCVIYAGAKVFGGIEIGRGVVVGANSVVTKNVPDFAICAGIPMKILGFRDFSNESLDKYKLPPGVR